MMDMTRKLSAGSLLLAGSIAAAHAQDTDNDTSIDEVIVRSSPLRSSISEVVLGTSVIRREEIIRNLDGTIGETLASQPGVSSTFFGPGASRPIIRGLGADRIRILTNDISAFDVSTASQDHLVATEIVNSEHIENL
ncbi:MAG: TonB-dependent receptor plug domain-containing protein, partial [Pseudomonadota bacterium]